MKTVRVPVYKRTVVKFDHPTVTVHHIDEILPVSDQSINLPHLWWQGWPEPGLFSSDSVGLFFWFLSSSLFSSF